MDSAKEVLSEIDYQAVLDRFQDCGLILLADDELLSVTGLLAGPIRGSWWGHPRGGAIYDACERLQERPDVLESKLVNGKVTFVQRRLWPAFLALSQSRSSWQMENLSPTAKWLLEAVETTGTLETHRVDWPAHAPRKHGPIVAELERRILIHSEEVHTDKGSHARRLRSWTAWSKEAGFNGLRPSLEDARRDLQRAMNALAITAGRARGPWE